MGPCMSEPLLWLIIRILDCERTISEFVALGEKRIKNVRYFELLSS